MAWPCAEGFSDSFTFLHNNSGKKVLFFPLRARGARGRTERAHSVTPNVSEEGAGIQSQASAHAWS